MKEIQRRLLLFRHSQKSNLRGKTIILVNDGIATGASILAAIKWINLYSSLRDAIKIMQQKDIRRLPVVDNRRKMLGIVTSETYLGPYQRIKP